MIKLWGVIVTYFIYELSKKLKLVKYLKKFPPMMVSGLIIIAILEFFKIDYESYNKSACFFTLLLGPATISLAYPLVENLNLLAKNKRAVYFGFVVATFTAILTTFLLGKIFHSDWNITTSLLPKSVTTPIAVEISKAIGGIPELTACIVVITGIYGALLGHKILKLFHIKSDIAIGLAIGASSHVLGTSSCIEKHKEKQVVMATLALIIIGILTTVICVFVF
jgi:predicted murein hydrolase (TIGR00659 family)